MLRKIQKGKEIFIFTKHIFGTDCAHLNVWKLLEESLIQITLKVATKSLKFAQDNWEPNLKFTSEEICVRCLQSHKKCKWQKFFALKFKVLRGAFLCIYFWPQRWGDVQTWWIIDKCRQLKIETKSLQMSFITGK